MGVQRHARDAPLGEAAQTLRTQSAIEGIRDMILRRKVWPGEQVRQDEIAAALGMSKSRVREALKVLQANGLVQHSPNRGYFIANISLDGLKQIYMMRRSLETEVYLNLPRLSINQLNELRHLNEEIDALSTGDSAYRFLLLNRTFHFTIFKASNLDLIVVELERLWDIADSYRAIFSYEFFDRSKRRVVDEHNRMIKSLELHNLKAVVVAADLHRATIEVNLSQYLAGQVSAGV